jgi:hypothetical protein
VEGVLLAPWALPALRLPGAAPARLREAWARRTVSAPGALRVRTLPGWPLLEAGLRLHGGEGVGGQLSARFRLRRLAARLAAAGLPEGVRTVVAPSLAARELFARARALGARCVLVEDLPLLRALHDDLDRAAALHPAADFLRNHRARAADVARQEAERVLADEVWVRGAWAAGRLQAAGVPGERLRTWPAPAPDPAPPPRLPPRGRVLLLAGNAAARSGALEALALLEARPAWSLWARGGEGAEPALLRHPRVRRVGREAQRSLAGVDVVLAPALCETYPEEVERAVRLGLPVLATDRAAGAHGPDACTRVPWGDAGALAAALDALTALPAPAAGGA